MNINTKIKLADFLSGATGFDDLTTVVADHTIEAASLEGVRTDGTITINTVRWAIDELSEIAEGNAKRDLIMGARMDLWIVEAMLLGGLTYEVEG